MRWLALLLQIIVPSPIGFYLAYAMALGMPATSDRSEIPVMVILGGTAVGLLTWIFGLIADRLSFTRLAWTIALSMMGLAVSYLVIEAAVLAPHWMPRSWVAQDSPVPALIVIGAALAAPLAGAMAGYYAPWRKARAGQ